MIFYSWNVNGIRAAIKKGFFDWFREKNAHGVFLQEAKATAEQLPPEEREPEGYHAFWNPAKVKKGYSGVVGFVRDEPLSYHTGLPDARHQGEGRLQRFEYPDFHLFNVYFPNGQKDEERLNYKLGYYDAFLEHAQELRKEKPIIVCGDFNTAHQEIDLARPKANEQTSGFLRIERDWLDKFTAAGYLDTFRMFEDGPDHYSWWSFRAAARERNVGWRIDYFFVSEELRDRVKRAWIEPDVFGSDHCPIALEITD